MSVSVIGGCGRARAFGLSLPVGRLSPLYFRTTHSASKLRISAHPQPTRHSAARKPAAAFRVPVVGDLVRDSQESVPDRLAQAQGSDHGLDTGGCGTPGE